MYFQYGHGEFFPPSQAHGYNGNFRRIRLGYKVLLTEYPLVDTKVTTLQQIHVKLPLKHSQLLNQIRAILSFLQFGSPILALHQHFFTAPCPSFPHQLHVLLATGAGLCQHCKGSPNYPLWNQRCPWRGWGLCPTWTVGLAVTPPTPLAAPTAETHEEAAPQGGCLWPPTDADDGEGPKWPPSKAQFTGGGCSSHLVSGEASQQVSQHFSAYGTMLFTRAAVADCAFWHVYSSTFTTDS